MKNIVKIIFVSMMALFSSYSQAADLTADQVRKGIVGEWQLLSYERDGKLVDDYAGEKVIWQFKADGTMSLSDRQLGAFKDKYKVVTVIPLGYPAGESAGRPRKSMEEIVCYEQFAE